MTAPVGQRLLISDADDIESAAHALAAGSFVVHPLGNICTSANLSRHATGADEEPVHYRASPLRSALKDDPRLVVLEQDDEDIMVSAYPRHAPMSTTVLAFGALQGSDGRGVVSMERHGSLSVEEVTSVAGRHGFEMRVPAGQRRLPQRGYR